MRAIVFPPFSCCTNQCLCGRRAFLSAGRPTLRGIAGLRGCTHHWAMEVFCKVLVTRSFSRVCLELARNSSKQRHVFNPCFLLTRLARPSGAHAASPLKERYQRVSHSLRVPMQTKKSKKWQTKSYLLDHYWKLLSCGERSAGVCCWRITCYCSAATYTTGE